MYDHAHAPWQVIKYGVIGIQTLLRDLSTWDTLQVAGRLHKPVRHVVADPAVMAAADTNLRSALAASLLMLPQTFTTRVRPSGLGPRERSCKGVRMGFRAMMTGCLCMAQELMEAICGLSYTGDVRVGLAEDRHKVRRIVAGSFRQLQELYSPVLQVNTPHSPPPNHEGS
jgi:translocator assembly and maintenance protein 41